MKRLLLLVVLSSGCFDLASPGPQPLSGGPDAGVTVVDSGSLPPVEDLAVVLDASVAPPPDMARHPFDLMSTDLAGLVNCYGLAICNPNQDFCIRFYSGSADVPGTLKAPACYSPDVPCADNGNPMSCDCIQNDDAFADACQNCVDHLDGTYDCYAM